MSRRLCKIFTKASNANEHVGPTIVIWYSPPNSPFSFIESRICVRRKSEATSSFPNPLDFLMKLGLLKAKDRTEDKLVSLESETKRNAKRPTLLDVARLSSGKKSVASIQSRARTLINLVAETSSDKSRLIRLEEIVEHLKKYPVARQQVLKDNGISALLKLREQTKDELVKNNIRIALTLIGFVEPVKESGVRILSLDGGGTRGVITIEILKKIEEMCKKEIHEMFDLIVGTSTGAMLAFLLAVRKVPLEDILQLYRRLGTEIFQRNTVLGAGKLFLSHAYYDTDNLETILKQELGDDCLIDTSADSSTPKIAAVSSLVNHVVLQPYVFRNYCVPIDRKNNFSGSSRHKLWEALRASVAAPGFFEEFRLGDDIHQDGGLLTNNPCALAIHEAKTLWPATPIQAVVSVGTGMYHGRSGPHTANFTSLRAKLMKVVASATDVEAVHITLQDLLPATMYFRFNPNMSLDVPLDECDPEVLEQLQVDTRNYINKFRWKFENCTKALMKQKSVIQAVKEKVDYKMTMRR